MPISIGDTLPETTFRINGPDGPEPKTTSELFSGRTVMLVGVPGAFTPTCHKNHLPGYLEHLDAFKAKGVDAVLVTAVNDPFVMKAWAEASGGKDKVEFLSDGNGEFADAIGLSLDGTGFGLGKRSQRYAMVVADRVVKAIEVEDVPSKADVSGATNMLGKL